MATKVRVLVPMVHEELRNELTSGFLSESMVAGIIGSAIAWLNGYCPETFSYVVADLGSDGAIALDSTISPEIDPYGKWGALLRQVARAKFASGGALVRAEQNMGSFSGPNHRADTTSRSVQHRLNADREWAAVDEMLRGLRGFRRYGQGDADLDPIF